jgi:hypothetical protein
MSVLAGFYVVTVAFTNFARLLLHCGHDARIMRLPFTELSSIKLSSTATFRLHFRQNISISITPFPWFGLVTPLYWYAGV